MSNQKIRKFRKNDWSDEEFSEDYRSRKDKRKERRFERALRTKDVAEIYQDLDMYVGEEVLDNSKYEGKN